MVGTTISHYKILEKIGRAGATLKRCVNSIGGDYPSG